MTSTLKNKTIMVGAVVAVMAMTAAPSHADLTATSKLLIDNFIMSSATSGTPLQFGDFTSFDYSSSADMDGSLTNTGGFGFSVPNGANIDFPSSCLTTTGACAPSPLPENGFPHVTGAQGTDFVAADQTLVGVPISNVPGFDPAAGASLGQQATASLSATDAAGTANVNNGIELNFTLAAAGEITFSGDFVTYLEAFASAGELFPGTAIASTTFEITITDLFGGAGVVYSYAPDLLNETTSVNPNDFGFDIQTCGVLGSLLGGCGIELAGLFTDTTGTLLAGTEYQLSLRSNANIGVARVSPNSSVPVPGTLALFGLGLMGLTRLRNKR